MPLVCNYYLTLRCNARCSFCDLWQRPSRELADTKTVLANLRQLPAAGVRIVDFTGGEPLLHTELPQFLSAARQLNLRTTLTTNALLYPQRARELRGLVNLLHFSLDAAQANRHDDLRGVPSFDKVMESLELAVTLEEKPEIIFTATPQNYLEIIPLAKMAAKLRLMLLVNPVFNTPSREGNSHDHEGLLTREQLLELVRLCYRPYVYLNGGVTRLMLEGGNNRLHPRCRAVSATVVISPDNKLLLPCFHFQQDAVPLRGDLAGALNHPARQVWSVRQGRANFCQGCMVNCYLAPSLVYRLDRYLLAFLPWAARYFFYKSCQPKLDLSLPST